MYGIGEYYLYSYGIEYITETDIKLIKLCVLGILHNRQCLHEEFKDFLKIYFAS